MKLEPVGKSYDGSFKSCLLNGKPELSGLVAKYCVCSQCENWRFHICMADLWAKLAFHFIR